MHSSSFEQRKTIISKPAIVLVHGFWGGGAHWGKVILDLTARGYTNIHAVENPLTSLADDAARTQQMVKQIDGPVLLFGHSYGGAVITEAGNLPNVVGLVYIAAFAPDSGESPGSISQAQPSVTAEDGSLSVDSDGYLGIAQDQYQTNFCQDLNDDDSRVMAVTQKAPLASTFGDNVTEPAGKHKPTWYQVSEDDRMINPDAERMMAQRMNPTKLIELASGHASLASLPKEVSDLIDEAASSLS
ncbi:alpha/beta hydrolase superfamily [Renibacterium salmoninarum ATCC 33209]|uniref:Alpha/beta hydrolase superfamily n=1 Tax=Renibacterium salmoninarum (strain ATCC 33209 / DSM 20767 / JCM 11484 / NBRC 15589 / NCIMB 2235) TaxID=288705 RepID=A9WKT8_RENSM|nr:alpha/beta hydrolase [Renibacterium salmoninarum]ABY22096.1 alpha/beta hydrolase superfamily [Renibacterium salmoninarum ATCC 33209]